MERANSCSSFFELFKAAPAQEKRIPSKPNPAVSTAKASNPDLAPASAGEDRPDRWRDPGAHPDGLQARRAAGVFDGQGADAAGGGPPACLPRAQDAGG